MYTFVNCASLVMFTVEAGLCYKGRNLVVSQSNTCSVNTQFNQCKESSGKRHHGLWFTMSLIESIQKYDLEGVKAALQSGADVNTRDEDEYGWPPLIWAVTKNCKHQNTVISLLLSSPNIDVNLKTKNHGGCALHFALYKLPESSENNDALKLLLDAPTIDVNSVDNGWSAVNRAVFFKRIGGLKLLLSHPRLTNLSINNKDIDGNTPVMLAMKQADYPATSLGNRYVPGGAGC